MTDLGFYKGRKVLLTGHTGFKGSWASVVLANKGARVIGYSSCSKAEMRLFDICGIRGEVAHVKGDIRDLESLWAVFDEYQPEVVIHMAAQPIVREGYENPVGTYETNVMGTVNVLDCVRRSSSVKSFLNVTTDKVYANREWEWGYREIDPLDGFDPYSNSKSCSELVTHSYKNSFFSDKRVAISTARAGNVIGGGDFAKDRIIPDCVRAALAHGAIVVRNPHSIRPYQHVLEPVFVYLMIAARQYENCDLAGWYNVGPDETDCVQTGALVELFAQHWGESFRWVERHDGGPHEASFLRLDSNRLKSTFGWKSRWDIDTAVAKTVEWTKCWRDGGDVRTCMNRQIEEYIGGVPIDLSRP